MNNSSIILGHYVIWYGCVEKKGWGILNEKMILVSIFSSVNNLNSFWECFQFCTKYLIIWLKSCSFLFHLPDLSLKRVFKVSFRKNKPFAFFNKSLWKWRLKQFSRKGYVHFFSSFLGIERDSFLFLLSLEENDNNTNEHNHEITCEWYPGTMINFVRS